MKQKNNVKVELQATENELNQVEGMKQKNNVEIDLPAIENELDSAE